MASNKILWMLKAVDMSGVALFDGRPLLTGRLASIATVMVFEMWTDKKCTCQDRRISMVLTSLRASKWIRTIQVFLEIA